MNNLTLTFRRLRQSPASLALDWQPQTRGFADMAIYQWEASNLTGADAPQPVPEAAKEN